MLRLRLRWDGKRGVSGIDEEAEGNIGRRSRPPMEGGAIGVTVERLTQDATELCLQPMRGWSWKWRWEALERRERRTA